MPCCSGSISAGLELGHAGLGICHLLLGLTQGALELRVLAL